MHTLKFNDSIFQISDYVLDGDILAFDAKFPSRDALNKLISFTDEYSKFGNSYNYQIDDESYTGRFGNIVYDVENNVRFHMTTTPDEHSHHLHDTVLEYNAPSILNDYEKRFSTLINLLKDNGMINENDAISLTPYLPANGKHGIDLAHQVKCLNDYLTLTESTMEDIRKGLNDD